MKKEAKKARRERFPKHEMTKNLRLFFGERGRASLKGEREGSFSFIRNFFLVSSVSSAAVRVFPGKKGEKKRKRREKKERESSLLHFDARASSISVFVCTQTHTHK